MPIVTFPDGNSKQFELPATGIAIAQSISNSLAKKALAVEVNGDLYDLSHEFTHDISMRIITASDPEGLEIIRHDTAHILAQALKNLFPEIQITIGPVIKDGFYYDISGRIFSEEDFDAIEQEMHRIVKAKHPIIREEWNREKAIQFFHNQKEYYKVELIKSIPTGETITLYRQNEFIDLCRGPHALSTGYPKAFKLLKIAGAYWRGDSNNEMLQRIYGTAWATDKQLKDHLYMLEEQKKRDHRKIGTAMDLFHIQEDSPGMIFWHANGYTIFKILENYIRDEITQAGYFEVKTPILAGKELWEKSGHWDKFADNMFMTSENAQDENTKYMAIKPMNCPCHVQIFNKGIKSYKQLPIRMAEFGSCHRNESSGSLHGLLRVRGFTQDDAHIFCTKEQITEETIAFCHLLKKIYKNLGFNQVKVKFSDRPEVRAGSDDIWDQAEKSLLAASNQAGIECEMNPGEGAFYGPKLEFILRDAVGRDWQCGTLQVDFVMPERLGAHYIGPDGNKHTVVMIHRAILGTLERFIGILIEQYAGQFPLWLAPTQIAILTITDEAINYAHQVKKYFTEHGLRVIMDCSGEKINRKVRSCIDKNIPFMAVIGKKEKELEQVCLRTRKSNSDRSIGLEEAVSILQDHINQKM